jgi:hypothetical protein
MEVVESYVPLNGFHEGRAGRGKGEVVRYAIHWQRTAPQYVFADNGLVVCTLIIAFGAGRKAPSLREISRSHVDEESDPPPRQEQHR